MLTLPIDSCMFLITAMVAIAVVLYFPEHIAIMASRATFYWAGEESLNPAAKAFSATEISSNTAASLSVDL